jgi:hypothetical protein
MVNVSSMKLAFRWARRLFIVLQVFASILALLVLLPVMVGLMFVYCFPGVDYSPSELFHSLRRFSFRLFAGRTLRPFTLRASLPSGTSITVRDNTTI